MAPADVAGDQPADSCRARVLHKVPIHTHTCSPLKQPKMPCIVCTSPYSKPNCMRMIKTRCLDVASSGR